MLLLRNEKDIISLIDALNKCQHDVYLRSKDGTAEFNLTSVISRCAAIGELCRNGGHKFDVFCTNHDDEGYMLQFFHELHENHHSRNI